MIWLYSFNHWQLIPNIVLDILQKHSVLHGFGMCYRFCLGRHFILMNLSCSRMKGVALDADIIIHASADGLLSLDGV